LISCRKKLPFGIREKILFFWKGGRRGRECSLTASPENRYSYENKKKIPPVRKKGGENSFKTEKKNYRSGVVVTQN